MQQLKTKRVGIYVRVSTEMQSTEGYISTDKSIKSKNTVTSIILKLKIYTLIVVFQVNL
ncbi:site-specific recombinase [Staphylococcus aureus]|nr:site-specific recombinase [Staphylococcus aureus]